VQGTADWAYHVVAGITVAYAIGEGGKRGAGRATSERDGAMPSKKMYRDGQDLPIYVA
jgi:hypothetical protein